MPFHPKVKSLIPIQEIELSAQQQIEYWASLEFVKQMAIMPDVHTGYSLVIGGVALLDNVISPEGVGYDIGCGVIFCDTLIDISEIKNYQVLHDNIKKLIPNGFQLHQHPKIAINDFKSCIGLKDLEKKINEKLSKSLGTLGGGNHFIELGKTNTNTLGIIIHSGSRNPGHTLADHYMKISKIHDTHLPKGFLDSTSYFGKAYIEDMNFMLDYALQNRMEMLNIICNDILMIDIKNTYVINENHNHAIITPNGVLHRKGATPADKKQYGIIPGNMRDGSYITVGLGNEEYLSSASHGCGRKGSRKWASETFSLDYLKKEMKGIICDVNKNILDESPGAYKNIDYVINAQTGIVIDIVDQVIPIINIKASEKKRKK